MYKPASNLLEEFTKKILFKNSKNYFRKLYLILVTLNGVVLNIISV